MARATAEDDAAEDAVLGALLGGASGGSERVDRVAADPVANAAWPWSAVALAPKCRF